MTPTNLIKKIKKAFLLMSLPLLLGFVSCKEDIDEGNLYTFTGLTVEGYLQKYSDRFSSFNYIVERAGYDDILSAYGTYTCFAPHNEAVQHYIDSLYNDMSNADMPHNGMTQPGLEGLTDSLCRDITLFHLLLSKVDGIDMGNGMTITTVLGRDINTILDDNGKISINNDAFITAMDSLCENGVVHEIDHVITRSNRLIAGEMSQHEEFKLFSQALQLTGLADSLVEQERKDIEMPGKMGGGKASYGQMYTPEECRMGYTIFAETDETFSNNGIHNIDDLMDYARKQYEHSAEKPEGWYDYYRNHNITVSTGTDYQNPGNVLNMFVRYHILKFSLPYNKLVNSYNETNKVQLYEYYETMLPYTLLKVIRVNGKRLINRWVTNNTLTDRVAEMGTPAIQQVMRQGIEILSNNYQSNNGYIHPITDMLAYDYYVPHGVLNERMRFDDLSLLPEMMSNNLRRIAPAEVKARNNNQVNDQFGGSGNMRLPRNYSRHLVTYNGDNTEIYYLGGQDCGWPNYQGDELLCQGAYDFAFRLPPVPDGTYELRMGYTANQNRGMVQFYLGTSSKLIDMKAIDIPLDMRHTPTDDPAGAPDPRTGWCNWTKTEDKGIESDANMRNLGYMRGPLYYTRGKGGSTIARGDYQDLRRIIVRQAFEQGEYWLRFKTVLPNNTTSEFHLDYIELVPENVYNNALYIEDMY